MDLRKLKKLIDLVEESGIAELEVTEGEEKVRIVKHASAIAQKPRRNEAAAPATAPSGAGATPDDDDFSDGEIVKAQMVGTFYRTASPEAAPLVEVGSIVKEGDLLGVIESMKQIHEIESEYDGIVRTILAQNGQAVEYGTPLFIIE